MTEYIRVTHPAGGGELSNEPYTLALPLPEHAHRDRVAEQAVIREAITAWLSGGGTVQVPARIRSRFAIALFPLAWDAPGLDRWQTPAALTLLAGEYEPHPDCGNDTSWVRTRQDLNRCRTFAGLAQMWPRLEVRGRVDALGGAEWRHAVSHLAWTVIHAAPPEVVVVQPAPELAAELAAFTAGLAGRVETFLTDRFSRGDEYGVAEFLLDRVGRHAYNLIEPASLSRDLIDQIQAAPLSERAPEVGELLKQIRSECEEAGTGRWFAGDTTAILRAWFIKHGYETDGPNPGKADDNG